MISFYTSLLSRPQASNGTLTTLCRDIPNAESLVLNDSQRLFVSGREGVYELLASPEGSCTTQLVPLAVPGVRMPCMINGLAAHDNYLYLACAYVHQSEHPLVKAVLDDVNSVEQTAKGLLQLYVAAFTFRVESWIVRCDLRQTPLAFTEQVAHLPGDVASAGQRPVSLTDNILANGIAIDAGGESIYVANSVPGVAAAIYRVPANPASDPRKAMLWCRPSGCRPNGLEVQGDTLYYTGDGTAAAVLGSVPIKGDGSAGTSQVLATSPLHIFDDLAAVGQGLVIAQFGDHKGLGAGSVHFVSKGGRRLGVLKYQEISKPCAVAVATGAGQFFAAGDLLIVDKHQGRVLLFAPDDPWRDWLLSGTS